MTRGDATARDDLRRGARRAGWGVADQAVSSITNFGLALLVARNVDSESFGAFGIVFATYTLAMGFVRTLTAEPLALHHGLKLPEERRTSLAAAAGTALGAGAVLGAGCFGAGALFDGPIRSGLWVLAPCIPGLLLQDSYRLGFFVISHEAKALFNDVAWAIGFGLSAGIVLLIDSSPSMEALLATWGISGSVAGVVAPLQTALGPRPGKAIAWLREHVGPARLYATEFVAATGGTHLALYAVALVAGITSAGALRGGQLVMGPLNIAFMGVALVAAQEATLWRERSLGDLLRGSRRLALLLSSVSAIWGIVVLAIPNSVGREVLGPTWSHARATLLPLTVWLAASGVVAAGALGLRVLGRAQQSLFLRAAIALFGTGGVALGAAWADAEGAAWGLAVSALVGAGAWWWGFARSVHKGNVSGDESAPVAERGELDPALRVLIDHTSDE